MTEFTPYKVPKEPGRWRAITLAALVHAALLGLLWFGVRWQNEASVAVEAEVWSPQPREAAPLPQPAPEPEIKPEPKPEPVIKEIPEPQIVKPPVKDPDIALEQEKKRKQLEAKKRLEQERKEKERQEQIAEQKAEAKRLEKEKTEIAKKRADAEQIKKAAADKMRKQQLDAENRLAEQRRQEDLARMTNQAGVGGSGDAPKAQGGRAAPGYSQRVGAKIKSNTVFNVPDDLPGNPPVEYAVELLPDGSLRALRKLRPSGVPGFDEAVRRAIEKSAPYPPDSTGMVPGGFNVIHRPKDQ
jgi:colicin import membrane protein